MYVCWCICVTFTSIIGRISIDIVMPIEDHSLEPKMFYVRKQFYHFCMVFVIPSQRHNTHCILILGYPLINANKPCRTIFSVPPTNENRSRILDHQNAKSAAYVAASFVSSCHLWRHSRYTSPSFPRLRAPQRRPLSSRASPQPSSDVGSAWCPWNSGNTSHIEHAVKLVETTTAFYCS